MNGTAALTASQRTLYERVQSTKPTRYRVEVDGADAAWVFCAYDVLLVARLLRRGVRARAQPPDAEPFETAFTARGPERNDLWLTFVAPRSPLPSATDVPSPRCPFMHLFERRDDAARWRETHAPGTAAVVHIVDVATGWRLADEQIEALGERSVH